MDKIYSEQVRERGEGERGGRTFKLTFSLHRYVSEDVEKQWSLHKPDSKETINWSEYRDGVYGFLDEEEGHEEEHGFSYK